jgi:hypothetical protein
VGKLAKEAGKIQSHNTQYHPKPNIYHQNTNKTGMEKYLGSNKTNNTHQTLQRSSTVDAPMVQRIQAPQNNN